jgi:predicted lipid-binding transport protein (Tim44 family)
MNYSFEYIDIILLAMIAGFIFLRLRGILGKRTGFEGKAAPQFEEISKNINTETDINKKSETFDERAQKEFIKGAKIAYESIITDFSDDDNKLTKCKSLLSKKIYDQFNVALQERNNKGYNAEITFIGINSADIKEHKIINNILNVTVEFVGEVITCVKDKNKKIISGDPDKIKKIYDTWVFSRDIRSTNPNWQLVDILT